MIEEGTQPTEEEIYEEAIQISIGGEKILIYGTRRSVCKFLESCMKAGLIIEVEVSSDWCG